MVNWRILFAFCAATVLFALASDGFIRSNLAASQTTQESARMINTFESITLSSAERLSSVRNRLRPGERIYDVTTFLYINAATRSKANFMTWGLYQKEDATKNMSAEADFWSWGDPWKPTPLEERLVAIRGLLTQNLYARVRIALAINADSDLRNFAFIPRGTEQLDSLALANSAHQNISFYNKVFPLSVIDEILKR